MRVLAILLISVPFLASLVNSKKPKETFQVMKEDIPYIACDVCRKVVNEIYRLTSESRKQAFKQRLEEVSIVEHLDNICKPENLTSGIWIRKQDIIEVTVPGSHILRLEEPGGVSKCKEECATIAKSCDLLLEEEIEDRDDLSAILWKNKSTLEQFQEKVCNKWTSRCKNNKNKYLPPKYKRIDHKFEEVSDKELKMEEMKAQMGSLGDSMSMYSRDDMAGMMDGYGDDPYGDPYGGMGGMGAGPYDSDEEEF